MGDDAFRAVEAQGLARTEGLTTDVICAALLRAQRRPALRAQRARAFYAAPRGRDPPDSLKPDSPKQHAREQHVREQHGRGPLLIPEGELELCDDSSSSDDNGADGPPRRAASTPAPLLVARLTDVPCDRLDIAASSAADLLAEIEALPAVTPTAHDLERSRSAQTGPESCASRASVTSSRQTGLPAAALATRTRSSEPCSLAAVLLV